MQKQLPISACEPLTLPMGKSLIATSVEVSADDRESCRIMTHFHELGELVIYENVEGKMRTATTEFEMGEFGAALIPSMQQHDFELTGNGKKKWTMVHFEPGIAREYEGANATGVFREPTYITLSASDHQRMLYLIKWLVEEQQYESMIERGEAILGLLLQIYSENLGRANLQYKDNMHCALRKHRIAPVLELIYKEPGRAISLEEAAQMCCLSAPYFSKYFKSIYGMTFGAYIRLSRLHIAARMLLDNTKTVTQISYHLGFSQPSYFIASFKEQFKMTPKQYQSSYQNHYVSAN